MIQLTAEQLETVKHAIDQRGASLGFAFKSAEPLCAVGRAGYALELAIEPAGDRPISKVRRIAVVSHGNELLSGAALIAALDTAVEAFCDYAEYDRAKAEPESVQ